LGFFDTKNIGALHIFAMAGIKNVYGIDNTQIKNYKNNLELSVQNELVIFFN
jgi:hypothetical protein